MLFKARKGMFLSITISLIMIISVFVYFNYFSREQITLRGFIYDPPKEAVDFTLIDQNNSKISLSSFKGKIVILTFIYTNCPNECPVITAHLVKAYQKLTTIGFKDKVAIIFVTVDPERDNVTIMKKYAERFNALSLYFLTNNTGSLPSPSNSITNLQFIWNAYNVYVNINKTESMMEHHTHHTHVTEDYEVEHTLVTYIIDKDFKIRVAFYGIPPLWNEDDVVYDVTVLSRS